MGDHHHRNLDDVLDLERLWCLLGLLGHASVQLVGQQRPCARHQTQNQTRSWGYQTAQVASAPGPWLVGQPSCPPWPTENEGCSEPGLSC